MKEPTAGPRFLSFWMSVISCGALLLDGSLHGSSSASHVASAWAGYKSCLIPFFQKYPKYYIYHQRTNTPELRRLQSLSHPAPCLNFVVFVFGRDPGSLSPQCISVL
ncbi:hypothetical protein AVEN_144599-1 [Araneus ventricosus]|uniref:Secreted protein n=1 Tax=Araneus ventricosus TaxID=182803 RepID=A0A4Y2C097_ARAVE|nr:hypothetical protein AVEN_144599-1 [Araneus ventricosus]